MTHYRITMMMPVVLDVKNADNQNNAINRAFIKLQDIQPNDPAIHGYTPKLLDCKEISNDDDS